MLMIKCVPLAALNTIFLVLLPADCFLLHSQETILNLWNLLIAYVYYCAECTRLEKDRDGCPTLVNLGAGRTDLFISAVFGGSKRATMFSRSEKGLSKASVQLRDIFIPGICVPVHAQAMQHAVLRSACLRKFATVPLGWSRVRPMGVIRPFLSLDCFLVVLPCHGSEAHNGSEVRPLLRCAGFPSALFQNLSIRLPEIRSSQTVKLRKTSISLVRTLQTLTIIDRILPTSGSGRCGRRDRNLH
ncbi:hypothetical protein DFH06DRAFT_464041 [Mycena polygramma]|nr:hypothetical protein DFH06DRAFT_464041 [Mycena polygramma]